MTRIDIPPTLAPLPAAALLRGLLAACAPGTARDALSTELAAMFAVPVAVYDSGRAALADAMRIAMRATGRRRVVLPAYTSYSVAAAAIQAGGDIVLCDVDPLTLALDRSALRACTDARTAAVVLGNLFGWPEPTMDLAWLRAQGVLLIDDAAQALGAREDGRLAGSRGDLGVLSFGRGKCVSLGDGGALLMSAPALRAMAPGPASGGRGGRAWVMALAVTLSRSRLVFGTMTRLPGARIGESHFEPDFSAAPAPASVRAMAAGLEDLVGRLGAIRHAVAGLWHERLSSLSGLTLPPVHGGREPSFLRYPVLAASRAARERGVSALARTGFGFVRSFPGPLSAIAGFADRLAEPAIVPGAADLADRLIALPCHAGVRAADIDRAAAALTGALSRAERS